MFGRLTRARSQPGGGGGGGDVCVLGTREALENEIVMLCAGANGVQRWPPAVVARFRAMLEYQSSIFVHDALARIDQLAFGCVLEYLLTHAHLRTRNGATENATLHVMAPTRVRAQSLCLALMLTLNYTRLNERHGLRVVDQTPALMHFSLRDQCALFVKFVDPQQAPDAGGDLVLLGAERLFSRAILVRGTLVPRLSFGAGEARVRAFFGVTPDEPASRLFAADVFPRQFAQRAPHANPRANARTACAALTSSVVHRYGNVLAVAPEDSPLHQTAIRRRRRATAAVGSSATQLPSIRTTRCLASPDASPPLERRIVLRAHDAPVN